MAWNVLLWSLTIADGPHKYKSTHTHTHTVHSACVVVNKQPHSDSPRTSAPSSDAGCYVTRWCCRARSSSDTAGNCGNGGSDSESPSCRCHDSRSTTQGDRLRGRQTRDGQSVSRQAAEGKTAVGKLIQRRHIWSLSRQLRSGSQDRIISYFYKTDLSDSP